MALMTAPILLLPRDAPAITLTSNAAGFSGIPTYHCSGDSNNIEIEILYAYYDCFRQGVVEFDLTGTGVSGVTSGVMTLFDGAIGNSEGWYWTVDVYGYAADGQVTGADYDAGQYITSATWFRYAPDADAFAIDVTGFINEQLGLGTSIIGFNLRGQGASSCPSCTAMVFTYFDGAGGDRPPTLTLQPVPIPAAAWLLGSALASLGAVARRCRRLAASCGRGARPD
jgi:hypothetical protein